MSTKVSLPQLREQVAELLDQVAKTGEECVVQRDGKDLAVFVSVSQWRRRTLGRQLDGLGDEHRVDSHRAEQLSAAKRKHPRKRQRTN